MPRGTKLASQLADAAAIKIQAQAERDEFRKKNEELERNRAAVLEAAAKESRADRARLLSEAQKEADVLGARRREAARAEARALEEAVRRRMQQEVFAIARKALGDLGNAALEQRIAAVFIDRLKSADVEVKKHLRAALQPAGLPARVRSAFDLPAAQRTAIRDALSEILGADAHVEFETAPQLIGGIELTANGQRVAWSIEGYLSSLERGVFGQLGDAGSGQAMSS